MGGTQRISKFLLVFLLSALSTQVRGNSDADMAESMKSLRANLPGDFRANLSAIDDELQSRNPYFVVSFYKPINQSHHRDLKEKGAEVLGYIPKQKLLVRIKPDMAASLSKVRDVASYVSFSSRWKFDPALISEDVLTSKQEVKLRLKFFRGSTLPIAFRQFLDKDVLFRPSSQYHQVKIPKSEVLVLLKHPDVQWIEEVKPIKLASYDVTNKTLNSASKFRGDYSDLTGRETGTEIMNFESAWQRGLTGRGQIIGVADTGLDTGDLRTLLRDLSNVVQGFVFGMFSNSWADPVGHGTHVVGSIVGTGENSGGLLKGGAFESKLVFESMFSPLVGGLSVPSDVRELFDQAFNQGARIHSNSWGSSSNAYDISAAQTDEYIWRNPTLVILFAAGNNGVDENGDGRIDEGSLSSPSTAKNSITIGASENEVAQGGIQMPWGSLDPKLFGAEPIRSDLPSNEKSGLAAFSSRGPTEDGRTKPDLVAPGTNILSLRSQMPMAGELWGAYNDKYVFCGGTSMATPLAAGAAAVIRQQLSEKLKTSEISASLVKSMMIHSAKDLYPGQFGEIGKRRGQELLHVRPDVNQGYGRIDVDSATRSRDALLVNEDAAIATGETQTYSYVAGASGAVSGSRVVRATLVYSDPPGEENSTSALVNDLDLKVTGPNGKSYRLSDAKNNVEMLEVPYEEGIYQIEVVGVQVPIGNASGKQPFSLVVSTE